MSEVGFVSEFKKCERLRLPGLAMVVYGINPIPGQLDNTVATLLQENDVISYTYDAGVVFDGEPDKLPKLINDIGVDFEERASEYRTQNFRPVGASLGAFVAHNVTRQTEVPMRPGIYAAAGVNFANNLMLHPLYISAKRNYIANGYNRRQLKEIWRDIDLNDETTPGPEYAAVGMVTRLDQYAPIWNVNKNMNKWVYNGARLDIIRTWDLGHTALIADFDKSTPELLERADKLEKKSA